MKPISSDPLDRNRFPVDEWALVENSPSDDAGVTETVFSVGNGYFGIRGNGDEGRDGYQQGTFVNGFHETWPIRHAEEAFGFARVGQTIINAPDAKTIRLYVDDEPFSVNDADILEYSRRLDFRGGFLERDILWRTPAGKRVRVFSRRFASFNDRHLGVIEYEVTVLDDRASLLLSSQIINRQDTVDDYEPASAGLGGPIDPRKAESFDERVLRPRFKDATGSRQVLGYRTTNSKMTIAVGAEHRLESADAWSETTLIDDDIAKQVYRVQATPGQTTRLVKTISYHTSRGVPTRELADRCNRTLDRAAESGVRALFDAQREWLDAYWERTDVTVAGQPEIQQAVRWNLFQLAQASARSDGQGVAAKGVSGSGYGGHYFWDTEIYVLPYLSYTSPNAARNALRFRHGMLDAARERAGELNQRGALFPWRTINGLESSAYYAAGTAQYHIDADIAHALTQYVGITGDTDFLVRAGAEILIETARLWVDLGFWRSNGDRSFHIDGVTGPDEYTAVVDDNLYTNVMARENLRSAVAACRFLAENDPTAYALLADRLDLHESELGNWANAAEAMEIPYDEHLGIHAQDADFLDKELWDLEKTPESKRPLLLHYHPLVIYRFQVLKQADVVLALLLQGQEFTLDQKRRDFEYYDALTTGDSTLSAVVQSVIAAEVGYATLAGEYFLQALFVDLADLHHNASDGVHVASTGGIWTALVYGFAGMRDPGGVINFEPRLPCDWDELTFRLTIRGTRVRVTLTRTEMSFTVEEGTGADVSVCGTPVHVRAGEPVSVALAGQGPVVTEEAPSTSTITGTVREDGSVVTASIPTISSLPWGTE
ncbi:glycoside hydrolase family 65 protein [Mycetocola reblochoni]|uniref:Maltose phosphorylase / Trehalose phosphorylase n=2 Tax=Mycetocola reblochoni TaxID=331618 RepID=A0A1R4ISG3_9MICO|nr:glycosyl hydrolase family 65 protein [Mycetocola reblochoni]RLP71143.1 glycoside hydrolase family 65 protein [Mycetocola reblochoni]SJN22599.1 Maltose phosphorylase / Trehalose phosphorylase [Mycetocola reblochoni REB411]